MSTCTVTPRVSVEGRIVDISTGRALAGARIEVVHTGAPVGNPESRSTVSDASGLYKLAVPAQSPGQGQFDVIVSPPNEPQYRVQRTLIASDIHGDGNTLGTWVSRPPFTLMVELFLRDSPRTLIKNTFATFRRTGGAQLTGPGWVNNEFRASVDSFGRYSMFYNTVFSADGLAETVGDLYVEIPPPRETSVVRDIHVALQYQFGALEPLFVIDAGPSTAYELFFFDPTTGLGVPNVAVTFTRTGGIALGYPVYTIRSIPKGLALLTLYPQSVGTVVGNITVRPPPPDTGFVLHDVSLATFDGNGVKVLGEFGVGLHLPWVGIVRASGKPIAGVDVEACRVGGIAAYPQVITVRSDANGSFSLRGFAPGKSAGTLLVDLTFRPPAPYAPFVVRGVGLATTNGDGPDRVIGVWDVDAPPAPDLRATRGSAVRPDRQ